MWSELDDNDKEIYKRLILAYASLSEAFAQKEDFSSGSKKKLRPIVNPKFQVLNAMQYGNIPQNRERIYIVAFRNETDRLLFDFPMPIPLTTQLSDIIDFESKIDDKYYYTEGKYSGDIYEKSGVVPTLTANQGEGGHNVCLIKTSHGIRKMTPHECFNTQGFPKDYKLPEDMAPSRLYKQAGNSVCVSVIKRIAENLAKSLV